MGIVSTLTLAERRKGALEDAERRKRAARKLLRWGIVWENLVGLRYRYRDQLWPLVLLGVVALGGLAARGSEPVAVLAVALLGAAVVVFHLRRRLTRRAEWVYAACCLTAAAGWLVATSSTDARWVNVTGVSCWAVLSLRWWLHHEVRGWPGHSRSSVINDWNLYVRDLQGGPLAASEIDYPVPFEHGVSHTVSLVRGKQSLGDAQRALPKLEVALDIPMTNLIIEQHPDYPKQPSKLRLQVITRSPIENTVYFDAPRHEDGEILLGPYADGIGEAKLRLYTDNSMWSTFLLGGTGSGKTRLEEIVAVNALDMRNVGQHTVIFYMDGQNGASSPTLFAHATWAVGVDGALRMLAALERIAEWRQKENRAYGWSGFTPSPERPGVLVIIDEHHRIFPLASERFSNAAREWRKVGVSFFSADQDSNLTGFGAGPTADALRSALLEGNGLVMRVSSRIAGNLIAGLELNPFDLPKIPGYGVVVGAPGSGIRTAPFRGRYAAEEKDRVKAEAEGRRLPVPTIEEWFERYPPLDLDKGARRAAGRDYTQRHAVAQGEREELLAFVNGPDDEVVVDLDDLAADLAPEAHPTCAQRILALDWAGYGDEMERAQIFAEIPDLNNSTVTKALQGLVADGSLQRSERGIYRRTRKTGP